MEASTRYAFGPDADRARGLDARMRARLGESLRYVLRRAGDALPAPEGFEAFLERLARGPVGVHAFGAYYELVLAIEDDDLDAARNFLAEIAAVGARRGGIRIRPLADPEGSEPDRRYCRLVDTDASLPLRIRPPDPAAAESTRRLIEETLARLDRHHPALAGEIRALLGEIVLAGAEEVESQGDFDGVSSFMLWGGLVLRAGGHTNSLEMIEALAHEAAHNLLFGFATDGPLVANQDHERHRSPLRRDPRPVDGIYHATFVTARMHHAVRHLLEVGALDPAERDVATGQLEVHRKNFADGVDVLDEHGSLTATGRRVLGAAREYMAVG